MITEIRYGAILCGLALALAGCNSAPPDNRAADAQAIKDIEARWNQDFASKDLEKLVAYYADDAVLMDPGMPPRSGKEEIRKVLQENISDPGLALQFQASRVEVARSGDVAYAQGNYTMTETDPKSKQPAQDHGTYVTTYRKEADGSWKVVADIATSGLESAAPVKK